MAILLAGVKVQFYDKIIKLKYIFERNFFILVDYEKEFFYLVFLLDFLLRLVCSKSGFSCETFHHIYCRVFLNTFFLNFVQLDKIFQVLKIDVVKLA